MRRITAAFITAMLLLTGCSSKSEEPEISEIPEPVGDVTAEETTVGYREYTDDDFTDIDVTISRITADAPLKLEKLDTSWIKIESEESPCYYSEINESDYENYVLQYHYTEQDGDYHEEFREFCKNAVVSPYISAARIIDDKLYLAASFDALHPMSAHSFSVYECDLAAKTIKKFYTYSDPENGKCIREFFYNEDGVGAYIQEVLKNENGVDVNGEPYYEYEERVSCIVIHNDGSVEELPEGEDDDISSTALFRGEPIDIKKNDDRTVRLSNDKFCLNTSLKGTWLNCAADDRIVLTKNGTKGKVLYIYDLAKMERYVIDTNSSSGMGTIDMLDGNLICSSTGEEFSLLIPEIGARYILTPEMLCRSAGAEVSEDDYDTYFSRIGSGINKVYLETGNFLEQINEAYFYPEESDGQLIDNIYVLSMK